MQSRPERFAVLCFDAITNTAAPPTPLPWLTEREGLDYLRASVNTSSVQRHFATSFHSPRSRHGGFTDLTDTSRGGPSLVCASTSNLGKAHAQAAHSAGAKKRRAERTKPAALSEERANLVRMNRGIAAKCLTSLVGAPGLAPKDPLIIKTDLLQRAPTTQPSASSGYSPVVVGKLQAKHESQATYL